MDEKILGAVKLDVKKNWHRILSLLLIVVLVYWSANNLSSFQQLTAAIISAALPFIIGTGLAFVLNLPVKFMEKWLVLKVGSYKKWFRPLTVVMAFLLLFLVLFFLVFLVIPDLQKTITSFIEIVPQEINSLIKFGSNFIDNNPEFIAFIQELNLDLNSLQKSLVSFVQTAATEMVGGIVGIITTTVSSIVTVFIAIVFAVYVLVMKEALIRQFKKLVYSMWSLKWANYIVNVGKKANEIFSNYVGGQIFEAFILGTLVYLGMWLFNFPYRLSISVITGALALIPIYGAILGGVVGFVLISVVSLPKAFWFIIFIVTLQQIEGNIIYPRVVGGSVGLPGIWVMFSVTLGGAFFGLVGMLISVPIVSLLYTLVAATVNYRLEERNLVVETDSDNLRPAK